MSTQNNRQPKPSFVHACLQKVAASLKLKFEN